MLPREELDALESLKEHPGWKALCEHGATKEVECETVLRTDENISDVRYHAGCADTYQRIFRGLGKPARTLLDERIATVQAEVTRLERESK